MQIPRPAFMLDGSPYNGHAIRCVIPSSDGTATYVGDPVKLHGSSVGGYPTVIQAAAGNEIFGVVVGFDFNPADLTSMHRAASTERYCKVVPALDVIFEVQEDSVGGALTADSVGLNADIVVAAGISATGVSGVELDSSGAGTGAANLMILGLSQRPDNEIGTNAKWLVRINESQLRGDGTGV
jgi:hypothetical protein